MSDKFWWWLKRIRLLAACIVGGLIGFYVIYNNGFKSDGVYEILGGGIAIVVSIFLYYFPEWVVRLISNTRGDDELDEWVEGFLVGSRKSGKNDDQEY